MILVLEAARVAMRYFGPQSFALSLCDEMMTDDNRRQMPSGK